MPFPGSQTLGADFRRRTPPGPTILKLVTRLQLRGPQLDPREMAPGPPALLLLSLLSLPSLSPGATGCPAACRCYSATVECGALRLRVVPPGIPPGTQVGTGRGRHDRRGVCERPVGGRGPYARGRLPRWLEQPPSLPLACRRYSCRTTASRAWSQASWRLLPPCAISTCTTTACAPWSQAPLVRSHAYWSWHSQATGYVACVWVPSPAWPSCAYST